MTVTFAPTAPGLRAGSVQIVDDLGTVLATTPLYGTGQGSQIVFDSNTPATVLTSGLSIPSSVAIDGAGNAYVVDSANSQVLKITPGGTPTPLLTALALPSGVAVDGTGDVFITNTGSGQITKVTPAGVQTTISPAGLLSPTGIAADGSGNLFVVDSGNNRAVEIRPSGVQTTLTSELNQAFGIAVDGAGNVFIADTNNNRIVEVPFGKAQVVVPVSGLYLPSDVKVDAAGDLFIADHGNSRVVEWSAAGVQTIVPTNGVSFPIGLALDGAGDLFVTDDVANLAVELPRSQPPAFHFVNTVAGTTSSDSPLSATVENIGNQPLNAIAPGLSISKASGDTVFAQVAGTGTPADCTTAFSLAPGSSCNLSISFTATEDNVYRGSAVLTDNSLNANPATQSILLTGLGTTVGTLLTLTIPE